jgi:hypothetical protein
MRTYKKLTVTCKWHMHTHIFYMYMYTCVYTYTCTYQAERQYSKNRGAQAGASAPEAHSCASPYIKKTSDAGEPCIHALCSGTLWHPDAISSSKFESLLIERHARLKGAANFCYPHNLTKQVVFRALGTQVCNASAH